MLRNLKNKARLRRAHPCSDMEKDVDARTKSSKGFVNHVNFWTVKYYSMLFAKEGLKIIMIIFTILSVF